MKIFFTPDQELRIITSGNTSDGRILPNNKLSVDRCLTIMRGAASPYGKTTVKTFDTSGNKLSNEITSLSIPKGVGKSIPVNNYNSYVDKLGKKYIPGELVKPADFNEKNIQWFTDNQILITTNVKRTIDYFNKFVGGFMTSRMAFEDSEFPGKDIKLFHKDSFTLNSFLRLVFHNNSANSSATSHHLYGRAIDIGFRKQTAASMIKLIDKYGLWPGTLTSEVDANFKKFAGISDDTMFLHELIVYFQYHVGGGIRSNHPSVMQAIDAAANAPSSENSEKVKNLFERELMIRSAGSDDNVLQKLASSVKDPSDTKPGNPILFMHFSVVNKEEKAARKNERVNWWANNFKGSAPGEINSDAFDRTKYYNDMDG